MEARERRWDGRGRPAVQPVRSVVREEKRGRLALRANRPARRRRAAGEAEDTVGGDVSISRERPSTQDAAGAASREAAFYVNPTTIERTQERGRRAGVGDDKRRDYASLSGIWDVHVNNQRDQCSCFFRGGRRRAAALGSGARRRASYVHVLDCRSRSRRG